jgi:hypothetical protein
MIFRAETKRKKVRSELDHHDGHRVVEVHQSECVCVCVHVCVDVDTATVAINR